MQNLAKYFTNVEKQQTHNDKNNKEEDIIYLV